MYCEYFLGNLSYISEICIVARVSRLTVGQRTVEI